MEPVDPARSASSSRSASEIWIVPISASENASPTAPHDPHEAPSATRNTEHLEAVDGAADALVDVERVGLAEEVAWR